jgi:cephalosporin-C deacetylase-like acetyl esterase
MKRAMIFVAFHLCLSTGLFAQNLLSPIWKISFADTSEAKLDQIEPSDWKDVNLLLSWERQGFFWYDSSGCIVNDFSVPRQFDGAGFVLSVGLQCDVKSIYVNGRLVGGNLPNQFWTNRGAKTEFTLPGEFLLKGQLNRIALFISNLSYTGGISCNVCSITPAGAASASAVRIVIPAKDNLFSVDEAHSLSLEYTADRTGKIRLSIVNDRHQSFLQNEYEVEKGHGSVHLDFSKSISVPGFYECTAIMNDGGYSSDVRWFTIAPEEIRCTNSVVPRFRGYWNDALSELKNVQPEFSLKKVDSLCTGSRDGYISEMKSLGGLTIRGYYFVPRTSGKHAAILHLPGYGYGFQDLRAFLSNRDDVVELALCVRGHGISADVFNPGFGVPGVWGYRLCSETENAYRAIYMDCVRAVEFLLSRPEVDTSRIGVMGGSQGGGLTLATAGLCNNVIRACSFFDPFPCDTRDHLKIRTMCNREIRNYLRFYGNECTFEDALNVQDLVDTKGFAAWIRCPTQFVTSLFDDDVPPHLGFSAYNRISAPKSYIVYPDLGHMNPDAFGVQMQFLKRALAF